MYRCMDIDIDISRCRVCGVGLLWCVVLIFWLWGCWPRSSSWPLVPLAQSQSTWGQQRGRRTHYTCPHPASVVLSVVLAQWWQGSCCHVAHSDGSSQAVSRNVPSIISIWCRHCEVLSVPCCWPPDLGLLCCVVSVVGCCVASDLVVEILDHLWICILNV